MSALQALERIRIETKVGTAELSSMMSLDVVDGDCDVRNALRKNKPYLQCLGTSLVICSLSATTYTALSRGHLFTNQVLSR